MMARQYLSTPIGPVCIEADCRKLRRISAADEIGEDCPNRLTEAATKQLSAYFDGKRRDFDLVFLPHGSDFDRLVWEELSQIPYGHVVTYAALAAAIGRPTAVRAVANAVGRNPMLIVLPCHRVVSSHGLGGFSCGLEKKRTLLRLEGVEISEKTAFSEKYLFTFP